MKTTSALIPLLGWLASLLGERRVATAADLRAVVAQQVQQQSASLLELYRHFHANPELSFQETKTAARLAEELQRAGYAVTPHVGGNGVVAVLKNGKGPTLLLRTELDALPIAEQTGLPYASKVRSTNDQGILVGVMHACGHDVHLTCLTGAARVLVQLKDQWRGTLLLIGQPAEEKLSGARSMLKDGLFERFPRPDYCLALHVASDQAAGTLGYVENFALANVDSVDITIRGVGGHGAWPHLTKDPIVLAAETILLLQTIVSREVPPGEPAVVTVGAIHGGATHNVIPAEVQLQLTVRSYSEAVRIQLLEAIRRQTRGLALAAALPDDKLPTVTVTDESSPALCNDPVLTRRVAGVLEKWFGRDHLIARQPVMGSEDFGEFGLNGHEIPLTMFWLGAVTPDALKQTLAAGKIPPVLHSSTFKPDPEPTLATGVTALVAATLDLLPK